MLHCTYSNETTKKITRFTEATQIKLGCIKWSFTDWHELCHLNGLQVVEIFSICSLHLPSRTICSKYLIILGCRQTIVLETFWMKEQPFPHTSFFFDISSTAPTRDSRNRRRIRFKILIDYRPNVLWDGRKLREKKKKLKYAYCTSITKCTIPAKSFRAKFETIIH